METVKMNPSGNTGDNTNYNDIPPASPTEQLDDLPF
jgi:hypothetical protein